MDDFERCQDGRWDELFGDLEGEFEAELARDVDVEVADRVRYELGQVTLLDRFRASRGDAVRIWLRNQPVVSGFLDGVGADWVRIVDGTGPLLVAIRGVLGVDGLRRVGSGAVGPTWAVSDLRRELRDVAQARRGVRLGLGEGEPLRGILVAVFADHVELALHHVGECPRVAGAAAYRSVPLSALVTVRIG